MIATPKACCGSCRQGRPCCPTTKPRPAFERRRGLWLPRRDLSIPKNLLQYPSEAEWSGLWRPWAPALVRVVDMSCLPCCQRNCSDCDPSLNDADPMAPDPLTVTISGAIAGTGTLERSSCGGGGASWSYSSASNIMLDAAGCGDPAWIDVSLCVYCEAGEVKAAMNGGSGDCAIADPTKVADSWECSPFSATFTFETVELSPGGCPCGNGTPITVLVEE